MVCQSCGEPCQGDYCSTCQSIQHQEDYHGTPAEIRERQSQTAETDATEQDQGDDEDIQQASLRDGETRDDVRASRTEALVRDARLALEGEEQPETAAGERDEVKAKIDGTHDEIEAGTGGEGA